MTAKMNLFQWFPRPRLNIGQMVDGVNGDDAQQGYKKQCHHPAVQEVVDGQVKKIKANVEVKNGVGRAKGDAVSLAEKIEPLIANGNGKQKP